MTLHSPSGRCNVSPHFCKLKGDATDTTRPERSLQIGDACRMDTLTDRIALLPIVSEQSPYFSPAVFPLHHVDLAFLTIKKNSLPS